MAATVAERVRDLGSAVGPRARVVREAIAPKAREIGAAGEEPPKSRRWPTVAAVGIGAVMAFFLDPSERGGRRRREVTKDWVAARFRGVGRRTASFGRGIGARAAGFRERMAHGNGERPRENDATFAHRVETELSRGLDIASGRVSINAEDGVVFLRGAMERPSQIIDVERRVWNVKGVRGVENLLHLEGTPAPTG